MNRTTAMARPKPNTTVRLETELVEQMERVRDPERFPTQSAFIREAVRRMVREERRNRTRERMKSLAQDQGQMELSRRVAEAGLDEWSERVWGDER